MMTQSKVCILLSATLSPSNVPLLKRANAQQREEDYADSIKQWLLHSFPLVFIDNSNTESEKIKHLLNCSPNAEYISFLSESSSLGKSHGEIDILEYAFKHSRIVSEHYIIIKVTGRYFVENVSSILSYFLKDNVFVLGWMKFNFEFADSRLMVAQKRFYTDYFLPQAHMVDESKGIYFEHVFARAIHRAIADGNKWCLPIEAPVFRGISGTENVRYKNGFLRRLKRNAILSLTRKLINLEY